MTCGAPLVLVIAVPAKEAEIMNAPRADDWRSRGGHFSWRSAHHYLQVDRPDAFVKVLLHALQPADDQGPGALEAEPGAALLVDTSRERLPAAADLLRAEAPASKN
jgi:hypothetical protein